MPWLPIPPLAAKVNVAAERKDLDSLWHWYRKLIALRRVNPAMREGVTTFFDRDAQHSVVFTRTANKASTLLVAVNMKDEAVTLSVAADVAMGRIRGLKPLLVSHEAMKTATPDALTLPPFGVYIGMIRR